MSLESALYNHLSGVSGVTNLTSTRIYTNAAPDSPTLPYIIQSKASERRFPHVAGSSGMVRARQQLDCYGITPDSADAVAEALRNALDAWRTSTMGTEALNVLSINLDEERHSYTKPSDATDIGTHRVSLDFFILYAEAQPTG